MTDTSLIFNILAKDQASQAFGLLKIKATEAFDAIAERAFDFAKESVDAFAQGERSQLLLEDAFAKFPALADTNIDRLRDLNEHLQATAKYDHNAIAEGQAKLAMFKFTGQQIEQLSPLLEDFASKTGMGLSEAATTFGRAMLGQARGLKQVGINFKATGDEAKDFGTLMSDLTDKVGGFAEKEGDTALGKTQILKNEMEDLKEKIGAGLVPILLKVVPPLMQILEYFNKNSATLTKVLAIVGSVIGIIWLLNAAVRAYTTVQIALNIAMSLNPVGLIIIAIIALVAGIYLLWTNSAGFRDFFIGMWDHIWSFLKGIGEWFAGPFVNFFVDAWRFVEKVFSWDNIVLGFKTGINALIRAWNALDFSITIKIPDWVPGIGGKGFYIPDIIPDIPYLDVGGTVLSTGVAMVHRGEVVVPPGKGGGAATVVIDVRGGDSEFKRWIRSIVRVEGGTGSNSVQVAFGQ